jgi:hypothetical protein
MGDGIRIEVQASLEHANTMGVSSIVVGTRVIVVGTESRD